MKQEEEFVYYITTTNQSVWIRKYKEKQREIEYGIVVTTKINKKTFNFIKCCFRAEFMRRHSTKDQKFWRII